MIYFFNNVNIGAFSNILLTVLANMYILFTTLPVDDEIVDQNCKVKFQFVHFTLL